MSTYNNDGIAEIHLYSSLDFLSNHNVRTERGDSKIQQTSQYTGSESVSKRSSRAHSVCLGLLCVLLLAAVIVLCVQLFRKTDHFNINNATEEMDLLRIKTLQNEKYNLTKCNNLIKQNEQFSQAKTDMYKLLNDGWFIYQFSFYYLSSELKSWSESRRYCTEREADLMIINNREEHEFVRKVCVQNWVWIGLTDSEREGTWKWVDGSPLISGIWSAGDPNSLEGNEDCGMSMSSGWADFPCTTTIKWICEKNIIT